MTRPNTDNHELRFITRNEVKRWRVWVTYNKTDFGQVYFNDSEFGSKEASLRAAIAFRNKVVKTNNIPLRIYNGNGYYVKNNKNTYSDTTGINLGVTRSPGNDQPRSVFWVTKNMVNGKQTCTAKSIRLYGYINAWKIVAKIRKQHTGIDVPHLPPAPPEWLMQWAADRNIPMPDTTR